MTQENRNHIKCGLTSTICIKLYLFSNYLTVKKQVGLSKIVQMMNRILTGADIDPRAVISRTVKIPHTVGLVIGETSKVEAGVILMPHVVLGARDHKVFTDDRRHPHVKEYAVIGAGAVLLGPITIGKESTIGANSVVLTDIGDGMTAVGIPAKVIKTEAFEPVGPDK